MFSGIIKQQGKIINKTTLGSGIRLNIEIISTSNQLKLELGSSLAVDGACLTVMEWNEPVFAADLSPETLRITLFDQYPPGKIVNIEPAITLNTLLDGHIVQGHVDGLVELTQIQKTADFYRLYFRALNPQAMRYIAYKGSLAINGVSLTVAGFEKPTLNFDNQPPTSNEFSIALVPYTYNNTSFKYMKVGDKAHLETDMIARYLESLARPAFE